MRLLLMKAESLVFTRSKDTRLNPTYNKVLKIIIAVAQVKKQVKMPRIGNNIFSSINPSKIVGTKNPTDHAVNFK